MKLVYGLSWANSVQLVNYLLKAIRCEFHFKVRNSNIRWLATAGKARIALVNLGRFNGIAVVEDQGARVRRDRPQCRGSRSNKCRSPVGRGRSYFASSARALSEAALR
jgi:hypothetical protein